VKECPDICRNAENEVDGEVAGINNTGSVGMAQRVTPNMIPSQLDNIRLGFYNHQHFSISF